MYGFINKDHYEGFTLSVNDHNDLAVSEWYSSPGRYINDNAWPSIGGGWNRLGAGLQAASGLYFITQGGMIFSYDTENSKIIHDLEPISQAWGGTGVDYKDIIAMAKAPDSNQQSNFYYIFYSTGKYELVQIQDINSVTILTSGDIKDIFPGINLNNIKSVSGATVDGEFFMIFFNQDKSTTVYRENQQPVDLSDHGFYSYQSPIAFLHNVVAQPFIFANQIEDPLSNRLWKQGPGQNSGNNTVYDYQDINFKAISASINSLGNLVLDNQSPQAFRELWVRIYFNNGDLPKDVILSPNNGKIPDYSDSVYDLSNYHIAQKNVSYIKIIMPDKWFNFNIAGFAWMSSAWTPLSISPHDKMVLAQYMANGKYVYNSVNYRNILNDFLVDYDKNSRCGTYGDNTPACPSNGEIFDRFATTEADSLHVSEIQHGAGFSGGMWTEMAAGNFNPVNIGSNKGMIFEVGHHFPFNEGYADMDGLEDGAGLSAVLSTPFLTAEDSLSKIVGQYNASVFHYLPSANYVNAAQLSATTIFNTPGNKNLQKGTIIFSGDHYQYLQKNDGKWSLTAPQKITQLWDKLTYANMPPYTTSTLHHFSIKVSFNYKGYLWLYPYQGNDLYAVSLSNPAQNKIVPFKDFLIYFLLSDNPLILPNIHAYTYENQLYFISGQYYWKLNNIGGYDINSFDGPFYLKDSWKNLVDADMVFNTGENSLAIFRGEHTNLADNYSYQDVPKPQIVEDKKEGNDYLPKACIQFSGWGGLVKDDCFYNTGRYYRFEWENNGWQPDGNPFGLTSADNWLATGGDFAQYNGQFIKDLQSNVVAATNKYASDELSSGLNYIFSSTGTVYTYNPYLEQLVARPESIKDFFSGLLQSDITDIVGIIYIRSSGMYEVINKAGNIVKYNPRTQSVVWRKSLKDTYGIDGTKLHAIVASFNYNHQNYVEFLMDNGQVITKPLDNNNALNWLNKNLGLWAKSANVFE